MALNNCFINPYTFIPIPGKEPDRKDFEKTMGNLTGYLECSMEIKSPTFIPNTTKRFETDVKEHYKYDFYSYEDLSKKDFPTEPPKHPVIPGSEIRGMIRNVYEQLTNSCFPVVDENNWPYKRTNEPKKPYLLKWENNSWILYEKPEFYRNKHINAVRGYKTGSRFNINHKSQKTVFGITTDYAETVSYDKNGKYVLHLTGEMTKKNNVLFAPNSGKRLSIKLNERVLLRFEKVIDSYCKTTPCYIEYRKMYNAHETLFVYAYIEENNHNLIYLSPASMTKEFFDTTIDKILGKQGSHNKCTANKMACPACRLFGMIGDDSSSITSRVRFSDATEEKNNPAKFIDPQPLPILGSPRISATEFYLKRPETNVPTWNYDYYSKYPDNKSYCRTQVKNPKLSGRKVYWHGKYISGIVSESKLNCTVRPMLSGKFNFKVFFENVTDNELKYLMFCLKLNGEGIHKIGKGKPIGMGDNIVFVNAVKIRSYNYCNGIISAKFDYKKPDSTLKKEELPIEYQDSLKNILIYTSPLSDEEKEIVHYPRVREGGAVFEWFSKNRGTSIRQPEIIKELPRISAAIKTLPNFPVTETTPVDSSNKGGIANNQPRSGSGGHPQNRGNGNGKQNAPSINFDAALKDAGKKKKW